MTMRIGPQKGSRLIRLYVRINWHDDAQSTKENENEKSWLCDEKCNHLKGA